MPIKLTFKCSDYFWKRILEYKRKNGLVGRNETVIKLIKKGLQKNGSKREESQVQTDAGLR